MSLAGTALQNPRIHTHPALNFFQYPETHMCPGGGTRQAPLTQMKSLICSSQLQYPGIQIASGSHLGGTCSVIRAGGSAAIACKTTLPVIGAMNAS